MKPKSLAAILVAVSTIALISCDWLFKKKPVVSEQTMIGKWKLTLIKDSSHINDPAANMGLALMAFASEDTWPAVIEFKKDSLYSYSNNRDSVVSTGKYVVDSLQQLLFTSAKNDYDTLQIEHAETQLLQLTDPASHLHFTLKKDE